MNTIRFTVYIPSHNYGHFLEEAVESVLRQTTDEWELLIINDGSTDSTAKVMSIYETDERVRLFHTDGIGLHAVCNLALKEAKGEFIVRLDGDDIFDEHILHVLGNALDRNEDAAMVFPDYYLIDDFGEVFAHEQHSKIYEQNHINDMPPHGACTLFRTSALKEIGGYSDVLNAQDGYYVWSKLVPKYKCINVNLPLFYYRQHGKNLTQNSHKIFSARRQIKRETILARIQEFKPISIIIPCRKNYDFQSDLWNERLNGVTLLENSIQTCLRSSIFDSVIVASDNAEVLHTLEKYEDPRLTYFMRSTRDTIRSIGMTPTVEKVVREIDPEGKGISVVSYIQSPFVTTDTLEESVFTLIMSGADSSCAAQQIDRPVYRRSSFGLERLNPSKAYSNDFQKIYAEARTVIATHNKNLKKGSLTGSSLAHFEASADECFFINSPEMLKIARIMFHERQHPEESDS